MAVVSKAELLKQIGELNPGSDDATLALIENLTDTLADYETRVADQTDWKEKYVQNDTAWREKYRARFNGTGGQEDTKPEPLTDLDESEEEKILTFEELFSTKGE